MSRPKRFSEEEAKINQREYSRKWRERNALHIAEYNERSRPERTAAGRAWREKNIEQYRKYQAAYRRKRRKEDESFRLATNQLTSRCTAKRCKRLKAEASEPQ